MVTPKLMLIYMCMYSKKLLSGHLNSLYNCKRLYELSWSLREVNCGSQYFKSRLHICICSQNTHINKWNIVNICCEVNFINAPSLPLTSKFKKWRLLLLETQWHLSYVPLNGYKNGDRTIKIPRWAIIGLSLSSYCWVYYAKQSCFSSKSR